MSAMVGVSEAIDGFWEANEKGPRPHLGASQIGKPCERALVYGFRHAARKRTAGRMLRLWNRGHREEPALIESLRGIGFEVREYAQRLTWHEDSSSYQTHEWTEDVSPAGCGLNLQDVSDQPCHVECARLAGVHLRQWSFSDIGGHHAGSGDGVAMNPSTNLRQFPEITPDTWFGLEFKTYNTKGHGALSACRSVADQKVEHVWQMQEYMHKVELPWQPGERLPFFLYLAVNKNDDTLYDEIVRYDPSIGEEAVERARRAITARQLPVRFSNSAYNQTCKWCDYHAPCHLGAALLKSCRTCASVAAMTEGDAAEWFCSRWNTKIPKTEVPRGCDSWTPVTD